MGNWGVIFRSNVVKSCREEKMSHKMEWNVHQHYFNYDLRNIVPQIKSDYTFDIKVTVSKPRIYQRSSPCEVYG